MVFDFFTFIGPPVAAGSVILMRFSGFKFRFVSLLLFLLVMLVIFHDERLRAVSSSCGSLNAFALGNVS